MRVEHWIAANTRGSRVVVELGAGFCEKLDWVPAQRKIGLDIFPAYFSDARVRPCEKIAGDMRDYRKLLPADAMGDTVMLIDVLEHIPKQDGYALLCFLQRDFRKILIFTPDGLHVQEDDATGYGNPHQKHECGWTEPELEAMGFACEVDANYHERGGMLFAVWSKMPA